MMQSRALLLLNKMVPEFIESFHKRYTILRGIHSLQPVGRRALALSLNMSERTIRNETSFLKESGMIKVHPSGMEITSEGKVILEELMEFDHDIKGLYNLEKQLEEILNLDKVLIVPGDADQDKMVLDDIGKAGARYLKGTVADGDILSITGGSTVGALVEALPEMGSFKNTMVVPARGGMGGNMEYQSNTLAATFANKLGGSYRMLHVPGQLSAGIAKTLLNEPDIRDVMEHLGNTDILIYGMGKAKDMAIRRNLPANKVDIIKRGKAVAEAFGYFFDKDGKIVYSSNPIGIKLQDLKKIPTVIGVVGGRGKAQAVMAFIVHCPNSVLVMDEGIAREILNTYK